MNTKRSEINKKSNNWRNPTLKNTTLLKEIVQRNFYTMNTDARIRQHSVLLARTFREHYIHGSSLVYNC